MILVFLPSSGSIYSLRDFLFAKRLSTIRGAFTHIRAMPIHLGFRTLLLGLLLYCSCFVIGSNPKSRLEDLFLSVLAGGLPHEFGRFGTAEIDRFIASHGSISKMIPQYYLEIANAKHAQNFRVASHHPSAHDGIVSLIAGVSCVFRAEGVGAPIVFSLTDPELKEEVDAHLGSAEAGNERYITSQCMTGQIALPEGMERRVAIREAFSNDSLIGYRYDHPSSHEVVAEDIVIAYDDFVDGSKSFSKGFTKLRIDPDRIGQHLMVPINMSSRAIVNNRGGPFLPGGAVQNVRQGILQIPVNTDGDDPFQDALKIVALALGFVAPLVGIRGSLQTQYRELENQDRMDSPFHHDRMNRLVSAVAILLTGIALGSEMHKGAVGIGSRLEIVHGISITLGKMQKEFRMRKSDKFGSGTPFVMSAWLRIRQLKERNFAHGLPLGIGAVVSFALFASILYQNYLHHRRMATKESALALKQHFYSALRRATELSEYV